MEKKLYEKPELTKYGKVEEITAGPGRGIFDLFLGAIGIGNGSGGLHPPYDNGGWLDDTGS